MRNPCRIDAHQVPIDGGMRRKTCGVLQDLLERQLVVPLDVHASRKRCELELELVPPRRFSRRHSAHDFDRLREGQHTQDIFEGSAVVTIHRHDRIVLCQLKSLRAPRRQTRKEHRHTWEKAFAMTPDKGCGRYGVGDDEVGSSFRV